MYILLYNPKSKNKKSFKILTKIITYFDNRNMQYDHKNLLLIQDYQDFFDSIKTDQKLVVIGGDGTFSTFMNNISNIDVKNDIYFYPAGTGNDFVKNLNSDYNIKMFNGIDNLQKVKADLPIVVHNNDERHFINGIGLGFDGEVAKTVNTSKMKNTFSYLTTAIKTIFSFETFNIEVTVDKEKVKLKNVWLIAIQNGKFFGGGMMICPKASLSDEKLDICVVHSLSKMKFLRLLPSVFSGNHLKHHQYIYYNQGSKISVVLDTPKCGQIDGDLLNETTEITASLKKKFFDIF